MAVSLHDLQATAPCPGCGYEMFLVVSEVAAQTFVRCPCCRVLVRLVDADASTHTAAPDIDKALRQVSDALGRTFGKGLR